MGTEDKQMRKERNLRYQMRKKAISSTASNGWPYFQKAVRTAARYKKNGYGYWGMNFSTICFKQ